MAVLCLALVAIALPPAKIAWALTALAAGLAAAGLATWCWSALAGVVTLALFLGGAGHLWLTEPLFFVRVKSDLSGPADLLAAGLLLTEAGIALTIGTVIGVYALWVLFQESALAYFEGMSAAPPASPPAPAA